MEKLYKFFSPYNNNYLSMQKEMKYYSFSLSSSSSFSFGFAEAIESANDLNPAAII
jgi:hypothetical protein